MTSLGAEAPWRSSWTQSRPRNAPRVRYNAPQTGPDIVKFQILQINNFMY